ncbi:MAG: ATP-binding protein, partial [Prolixibacteraceae bacterium]
INNYTLLTIKDNGTGIDMDQNGKQLFSPFQRFNKKKVKGTGIGLYIVKSIIEKNDGYIEVESTPGEGTAFYCYLKPYKE